MNGAFQIILTPVALTRWTLVMRCARINGQGVAGPRARVAYCEDSWIHAFLLLYESSVLSCPVIPAPLWSRTGNRTRRSMHSLLHFGREISVGGCTVNICQYLTLLLS